MSQQVSYPLRKEDTKWTPEFRKEWNREYRRKVKEGLIQPQKRKEEPSKWDDKEFRRQYDLARKQIINKEKQEKKLNAELETRPNFTKKEKEIIMQRLIEQIRDGSEVSHPYFRLGLVPTTTRQYPKKSQENSSSS